MTQASENPPVEHRWKCHAKVKEGKDWDFTNVIYGIVSHVSEMHAVDSGRAIQIHNIVSKIPTRHKTPLKDISMFDEMVDERTHHATRQDFVIGILEGKWPVIERSSYDFNCVM